MASSNRGVRPRTANVSFVTLPALGWESSPAGGSCKHALAGSFELSTREQHSAVAALAGAVNRAVRDIATKQPGLVELWSDVVDGLAMRRDRLKQGAKRRARVRQVRRTASFGLVSTASSSPSSSTSSATPDDGPLKPTLQQMLTHPISILALIPKDISLFVGGAVAGATAKTATAPFDRVKLLLQVQSVQEAGRHGKVAATSLFGAFAKIFQKEGLLGYWKGNIPQVVRIIPYSAVQLFAYDAYKRMFSNKKGELSLPARLAAGACAGMTSTLVTFPLDTLRLRLAVDPTMKSMSHAVMTMMAEEGVGAFYRGLVPSLLGIAPYIALNFCTFDMLKKAVPEKHRDRPEASFLTALAAATLATLVCYPLDTIRRQLQIKGSPFTSVQEAFPGIIKRDGVGGLYRGFLANALKNLPNSSIRLTTFDGFKKVMAKSRLQWDELVAERAAKEMKMKAVAA